ncbi:MAG TPA: sugar transferase [Candidatus Pacearchaeota archaeon]|nr:sugar transferase [Candidatus Parcubacteria bacterium]HOU46055.1 sugar transferase [Candidatus Pacearchaeota archaeon]HPM08691.1 sugar transferase [Candidatus Pacearchaeota archaeon]HQI74864.1 sugar transferase [Candidatus Pacearchaeota archaeon]
MNKTRTILILLSDLAAFYLSLFLTLSFKYGLEEKEAFKAHFLLFLILLPAWFFISYIFDLWQAKTFKNQTIIFLRLFASIFAFALYSMAFIYLFGANFQISPRRNLLIFCAIFFVVDYLFRFILKNLFSNRFKTKVFLIGESAVSEEITTALKNNPCMGYIPDQIEGNISLDNLEKDIFVEKGEILIVFNDSLLCQKKHNQIAYKTLFLKNIEVTNLSDFYELIFMKEAVEILDENWFIRSLKDRRMYEFFKRIFDILLASILFIILLPMFLMIAFLVKIHDKGPIFFNQERMGKGNKPFILHKFRSMIVNDGPVWTVQNDNRITPIGKFIRSTHLDEIPQLINIFKGDISFVGPRPEQTRIIGVLREQIPYYDVRHIVKPGLTGWAQIHYKASASVDETKEKLKYDFYYIKNASLLIDILVLIKTIKLFFINPE